MRVMQLGLILGVAVCVQLVPAIVAAETRVSTKADSIQVDTNNSTIEEVLTKLQTDFNVAYRSFVPLTDHVTGNFEGSLQQVVVRLLEGYDYVIKRSDASLDILVLRKNKGSVAQKAMPIGAGSNSPSHSASESAPPSTNATASSHAWPPPPPPNQGPVAAALYASVRNQVPGSNTSNDPPPQPPMDAAQIAALTQSTTAALGRLRDALVSLPR